MPTRAEYIKYVRSFRGGYGPARGLSNNDNAFNTWYYGRRVAGNDYAWCAAFECYCENHFGILKLNGGKVAYVPNMVAVAEAAGAKVWHRPSSVPEQGTSWAKPGNKIVFAFTPGSSGSHTGTFVERLSGTTFLSCDGNTETGEYSDAVADKPRSVHNVLAVIELLGVEDNTEDDMQPTDQIPVGQWMKDHWKTDKGLSDGKMEVQTTLASGYGHSRAAHENTDQLMKMVAAQNVVLEHLADAVKASAPDIEALKQTIKDELSKIDIRLNVSDEPTV